MRRADGPITVLVVALLVGCGVPEDPTTDDLGVPGVPGEPGAATLLEPVPADERVVGPAPSTTTPATVDPLWCTEDPHTMAERVLVARRQRASSPGCSAIEPADLAAAVCWDECTDGTRFVDFGLEPLPVEHGGVPYVAIYRTPAGELSRRAELLVLTPDGSGDDAHERLTVSAVVPVDLSHDAATARAAVDQFLAALAAGDHSGAATMLAAERSGATTRDDLAQLVDAGMIASSDVPIAQLADGIARWCADATCGGPADLSVEITPDHRVHVVATYVTEIGEFEVVFTGGEAGDGYHVEGLPPVLP